MSDSVTIPISEIPRFVRKAWRDGYQHAVDVMRRMADVAGWDEPTKAAIMNAAKLVERSKPDE